MRTSKRCVISSPVRFFSQLSAFFACDASDHTAIFADLCWDSVQLLSNLVEQKLKHERMVQLQNQIMSENARLHGAVQVAGDNLERTGHISRDLEFANQAVRDENQRWDLRARPIASCVLHTLEAPTWVFPHPPASVSANAYRLLTLADSYLTATGCKIASSSCWTRLGRCEKSCEARSRVAKWRLRT